MDSAVITRERNQRDNLAHAAQARKNAIQDGTKRPIRYRRFLCYLLSKPCVNAERGVPSRGVGRVYETRS